ncbi:hypothetical protein DFH05DRAFT_1488315 [Lentinula detonsa]|uniref:Uncharacterized protein n=1 Tax=Lentinula detonsa TaxID=2804962 RepID=A0A9W8TYF0_9AGAR|nr:hypothetical protein DFH05DRAFT_1488315 [Lentinula detonsa]
MPKQSTYFPHSTGVLACDTWLNSRWTNLNRMAILNSFRVILGSSKSTEPIYVVLIKTQIGVEQTPLLLFKQMRTNDKSIIFALWLMATRTFHLHGNIATSHFVVVVLHNVCPRPADELISAGLYIVSRNNLLLCATATPPSMAYVSNSTQISRSEFESLLACLEK